MPRKSVIRTFRTMRGKRVITCPETQAPAAVQVDAFHAAATALAGHTELRLRDCSRWPEREGCGQECLTQIAERPEDCLVRAMVTRWYEGKSCALCGKAIAGLGFPEHRPALMNAGGETVVWDEVAAERLPDVLATHRPICWDCHVVQTVQRTEPDGWISRPPRKPTLQ